MAKGWIARLILTAGVLVHGAFLASPALGAEPIDPCAAAVVLLEAGQLDDATSVSNAVGGGCVATIGEGVISARAAAERLVGQAQKSEVDAEKVRLAKLALLLDAGNKDAAEIVKKPIPAPTACAAADAAVASGEYARAKVLFDALADVEGAKECRAEGLAALALAQEAVPSTRISNALTKDLLPTLLLLGACFIAGVLLAAVWRAHLRHAVVILWVVGTGAVVGVLLLLVLRYALGWTKELGKWWDGANPSATEWSSRAGATWVVLFFVAMLVTVFAWALSNHRRDGQPVSIEVSGDADGEFAARVIAEIRDLGSGAAAGTFVPKGTDVSDSGVAAALGSGATDTIVKVLLAVWKAVQLKAADRVIVVLKSADDARPGRAVASVYRGSQVVSVRAVEGGSFCLDTSKPTKDELASSHRDVATGVAAAVIVSRLNPDPLKPTIRGLYGASDPVSIALCAVAARRLSEERSEAARELYERGVDADPQNIAARYGALAAQLRGYPDEHSTGHLVVDLALVEKDLRKTFADSCDELPLMWRLKWLRAASLANGALTGLPVANWASLNRADVKDAFRKAKQSVDWLVNRDLKAVAPSDRSLASQLQDNARAADMAFDVVLGQPADGSLRLHPRVAHRGVQFTVACGLAVMRVRAVSVGSAGNAQVLAAECVERVRLAGGVEPWRSDLLKDPFMRLVEDASDFQALQREWADSTPYDGVNAFGVLGPDLKKLYADPALLAAALATPSGVDLVRSRFDLDEAVTSSWRGAAEWLARSRPVKWINLYQQAGIPDAGSALSAGDPAVLRRLRAAKAVSGVSSLPTHAERVAMRP